jgi:pimeloyl-ACP methyl ester carboxylesterase
MSTSSAPGTIVLVHGAFADGSGWRGVYDVLCKDGYNVAVVQNPVYSLKEDAGIARRIIDAQDGPVVLAGHSYGGAVITEAGTDDKVAALVYITAFAPDTGESVGDLIANGPLPPLLPPVDGFLYVDPEKFPAAFAADVEPGLAAFMADSQIPWGPDAVAGKITQAAWRTKPSWYLFATEDHMIPPPLQHSMAERAGATTTEVAGSHAVYVSQPAAVAAFIEQAATAVTALQ